MRRKLKYINYSSKIILFFKTVSLYILLFQLILFTIAFLHIGAYLSAPSSEPFKSDLIVVLGGGTSDRLMVGIDLYKSGFANKILLTGFVGLNESVIPTYAKWRSQFLIDSGVPEESIIPDGSARTSYEEAKFIEMFMMKHGTKNILIVTDPPHLRRLSYIYSNVFPDNSGYKIGFVPTKPMWWNPNCWWSNSYSAEFVILEVIKSFYLFANLTGR